MKSHSPTTERMRMVKPKRKQANGNHAELGKCRIWGCVGWKLVDSPLSLRKGDRLCIQCSNAHTALLRRNEHWDWRYL